MCQKILVVPDYFLKPYLDCGWTITHNCIVTNRATGKSYLEYTIAWKDESTIPIMPKQSELNDSE